MASITDSTANSNLKSLLHDPDHYNKSFLVFAKDCAKFEVLSKWADTIFTDVIADKLKVNIPEGEEFRTLGVGSGSGEIESKMVRKLLKRFPRITNCVLEPAEIQITRYQELVIKIADELKGVTYDWHKQGLDEFRKIREATGQTSKFHFISAIQSLYYVDDVEDSQQWLYDQLEDGGMLIITIMSDDSGSWRMCNRFIQLQDSDTHFINSGHIRDAFAKRNIPFTNYKQQIHADITNCFEEGNKDGELKVDFLTHVVNFRETASPELRKEFMEYLGGPECSERKDGEVLLNRDWERLSLLSEQ